MENAEKQHIIKHDSQSTAAKMKGGEHENPFLTKYSKYLWFKIYIHVHPNVVLKTKRHQPIVTTYNDESKNEDILEDLPILIHVRTILSSMPDGTTYQQRDHEGVAINYPRARRHQSFNA